ncbi:PssD/Cps14F family polysaccharide biosynthesis glycosyltransferase [Shouchella miscanthi]|uniref:PssD/Cps14F family polysaccharide biosynthesis glycosyltransferase n=1 Tax=Shouchella miscanthi TaxID=2598861 RepID=UPI0011A5A121|nr:PssD/Cps14F family polysaccharide biosynthesis glycosyltransferase [Shouchella miscanthi]
MKKQVVFISSSGGHFSQLLQIIKEYKGSFVLITEKNKTLDSNMYNDIRFLRQQDRKKWYFSFIFLLNVVNSIKYVFKIKPKVVVTTGAGVTIPFCLLAKILGGKIIFIESFAKVHSPTLTGKIIYKFSDRHYVQWQELLNNYPKAIYKGAIY